MYCKNKLGNMLCCYLLNHKLIPDKETHPVVWKVLINYFSHLGSLCLKNRRRKEETNIQHCSLGCQCSAPMFWERIC